MRRFAIVVALALVGAIAGHLGGSPAAATNWGSSNCGPDPELSYCVAQDKYHRVYLGYLTRTDIAEQTEFILHDQLGNRTDMVTYVVAFGSTNDVRAFNQSYGDTMYWGATYCPTYGTQGGSNPLRWCMPQIIRYNTYYANKFDSVQEIRAIACHELGHTAGLRHAIPQGTSCMYDPVLIDSLNGNHDIPLINQRY